MKLRHTLITDTLTKAGRPLMLKRRERVMEEWELLVLDMYGVATPELRAKMLQTAAVEVTAFIESLLKSIEHTLSPEVAARVKAELLERLQMRLDKMSSQQKSNSLEAKSWTK